MSILPTVQFRAALLKVASRCNLDCDYCYVYKHADKSWQKQPKFMSREVIKRFAFRVKEYVEKERLTEFSVIFHGGEPLLYSPTKISWAASTIRQVIGDSCRVDFSLQTNGLLLDKDALIMLEQEEISISLSLDGPQHIHDLHRVDHAGSPTFTDVMRVLNLLKERGANIFRGVIAVIDPTISAKELLEFFYSLQLPRLDLLLPDATHVILPVGRNDNRDIYKNWLIEAFDVWYSQFPDLPIRWFDAILGSRLGIPSPTDVMGFGQVNLLVVETDGSYTDHDVFKITRSDGAALNKDVFNTPIIALQTHPKILEHAFRLTIDGIAPECKVCPVVASCAGGSIMHRYHSARGLNAPTVYCHEMFYLLEHATTLLRKSMHEETDVVAGNMKAPHEFTTILPTGQNLVESCTEWHNITKLKARSIIDRHGLAQESHSAGAILIANTKPDMNWQSDCQAEEPVISNWLSNIRIHAVDVWLIEPFSETIRVIDKESKEMNYGKSILSKVANLIELYDHQVAQAISLLISDILFVESTLPEENGIFSFSDDKAPNILYIALFAGGKEISPEDIADSIIHEFLHQVLYHLEREGPLLYDHVFPEFPAPWRTGLRPSGGFYHGTFVFSGLYDYWEKLSKVESEDIDKAKCASNAIKCRGQAIYGISSLKSFGLLTPRGMRLLTELAVNLGQETIDAQPPDLTH